MSVACEASTEGFHCLKPVKVEDRVLTTVVRSGVGRKIEYSFFGSKKCVHHFTPFPVGWHSTGCTATLNRTVPYSTVMYNSLRSVKYSTRCRKISSPPPPPLRPPSPLLSMSLILRYGVYTVPYTGHGTVPHQC